jgi:hypothetical protein
MAIRVSPEVSVAVGLGEGEVSAGEVGGAAVSPSPPQATRPNADTTDIRIAMRFMDAPFLDAR